MDAAHLLISFKAMFLHYLNRIITNLQKIVFQNKLKYSPQNHHKQSKQKHYDRNAIDAMHHSQIQTVWLIWVMLFENPYEIVEKFSELEIMFYSSCVGICLAFSFIQVHISMFIKL